MNGSLKRLNLLASLGNLPRDLRLLFLSLFLWTFGLGLYNYVWPIYLRELQANPQQVGLVFSVGFIAAAFSMIPGGLLANKYELRNLLIIGWTMSIPPPLTFYFARTWQEAIPGLVILQASGFILPAMNAYVSGAGDRERMSSAFGTVYAAAPLGIVFSPAVGSVLLNYLRIKDLFLFSFVFFAVSTLVLIPMRKQPPLVRDSSSPRLELPKSRTQVSILALLPGIAMAYALTSPYLPLYSQDVLKLSEPEIQLLGTAQMLGAAFFAVTLGKRAVSTNKSATMALGLGLAAIGVFLIPLSNSALLVFPLVFLFGAERAPGLIAYSVLSSLSMGGSRGGRFGVYLTLEQFGFVAGSYLGGILYSLNPVYVFASSFFGFVGLSLFSIAALGRSTVSSPSGPAESAQVTVASVEP